MDKLENIKGASSFLVTRTDDPCYSQNFNSSKKGKIYVLHWARISKQGICNLLGKSMFKVNIEDNGQKLQSFAILSRFEQIR